MNIYIANLNHSIDDATLKQLFTSYGEVKLAEVVKDGFTGASRGFGYVEMDDEAARSAITQLNQTQFHALTITVQEAPPKKTQKGSYKVGDGSVTVFRFKKN